MTASIALKLDPSFPPEVHAGTEVSVVAHLSTPEGAVAGAGRIDILDESGLVRGSAPFGDGRPLTVKAPDAPGAYAWTAVFVPEPESRSDGPLPTAPIGFVVIAHPTSVAVWGVTSPVARADMLSANIGLACRAGCDMRGHRFDVYDDAAGYLGSGVVGEDPWSGTEGLYWGEVSLRAPSAAGVHKWSVQFALAQTVHDPATGSFTFRVDEAPEWRVVVTACDESSTPVEGVEVRVGAYAGCTDSVGVATFLVPPGTFEVSVRKEGLSSDRCTIDVDRHLDLEIRMRAAPTYEEVARQIEADLIQHYV